MEIIQQIGSYAGLAAVVGLAVLAGLYFSQARDVKRLREWAGRAPERVPSSYQQPHRVVAQPVPPRPPVPPGASAGAQAAPAQTAAAGAAPAVATGPLAATPAAARAAESPPATDAGTQNTVARPPPRPRPQVLAPRAAPPGLGGHFAREAQIARAREEAGRVDVDPDLEAERDEGALPTEAEALEGERLAEADHEGEPLAGAHPEGDQAEGTLEGPEPEGGDLALEDEELEPDARSDPHHEDDRVLEPDGEPVPSRHSAAGEDALPDPEEFHEGDELLGEPVEGGDQRVAAPPLPPPPPPITATRQPLPPRPAPPPRGAQPPILPPYERSRPGGGDWETRRISRPKAALAVAGAAVVMAAAAFAILQLTGDDDAGGSAKKSTPAAGVKQPADGKKQPGKSAINPRTVTVSVLNGTTVGGLAAKLGDRLEAQGFQLGNVTNNTDQQRAESVVLFAVGAEKEAEDVGRRLKIDQREPIDPDSQTRAGDATVVVVTGADLNR